MKTLDEVNKARAVLNKHISRGNLTLSDQQLTLLSGMLNALVWVADGSDCTTMDRLLSGESPAPGAILRRKDNPIDRIRKAPM